MILQVKKSSTMNNSHIISVFDNEDTLLSAIRKVKDEGIKISEVYTPYPINEVIDEMGQKTRFTFAAFLLGLFGALGILAFLQYTAVYDWPLNYGGKPTNAFPSFVVVTLVLTILIITLGSLFIFSVRAKVYPGKAYIMPDNRSMDDKFVILIDMENTKFATGDLITILQNEGATEIHQKDFQQIK